ncbi:MAG: magnesium transporter, partial [Gammaproteobacteria bacterium]|nr:magnesium transporter [Gammaproteobacteria bacterium]
MNNSDQEAIQRRLQAVNDALDTGAYARVKRLQQQLSASDFADLMESSPPKARALLWNTLAPEERGEVLE